MPTATTFTTVADYIERLKQFPPDWRVVVSTQAGGGIAIEHREVKGESVVAVFGANGGRFGENPLTEDEYAKQSQAFLADMRSPAMRYTSIHGDHRTYFVDGGPNATCYGKHYDRRVVERMVAEGLIAGNEVDLDRVKGLDY
jgi:hypothetical protein